MQRIVTLTLNPAVDLSWDAPHVQPTHKIRTTNEQYDPGGGGLNVARVIHTLGGDATAILLAGGVIGYLLQDLMAQAGVPCRVIPIAGRTRLCLAVHDRSDNAEYRFVAEGPEVTKGEWQSALKATDTARADWIVASGSLPRGVPEDFYADLARRSAASGRKFVLDTSGPPLKAALGQGLALIKPSLGEFEALVGCKLPEPRLQAEAALDLVRRGAAGMIVVSLGAQGALLATPNGTIHFPSPPIEIRSAVGAGDSFVAGMTLALARGQTPEDALAYGIACGTSAVAHVGTARPDPEQVAALYGVITGQPEAGDRDRSAGI